MWVPRLGARLGGENYKTIVLSSSSGRDELTGTTAGDGTDETFRCPPVASYDATGGP